MKYHFWKTDPDAADDPWLLYRLFVPGHHNRYKLVNIGTTMYSLLQWSSDIEYVEILRPGEDVITITTAEEWVIEVLKG
jgi:hypothetical protein